MQAPPVSRAGALARSGSRERPSVRVRDLIADSTLEASAAFAGLSPAVTVVLPTFRRGDNGMLDACISSVLEQTFTDFELIVIDDGSTDATRAVIERHMAADDRVATIRHADNVGLPALSCFEGIDRGRGELVFFTFDDNTLAPDGLATMVAAAAATPEGRFFYGNVLSVFPGHNRLDGAGAFSRERLHEGNIIPNGAVLAHREVFERCGHYDPHITMTRLCDWDLWIRISQEFEMHHVDKVIATERGRSQSDSIGNTHVWDRALVAEWMSTDRSPRLRPDAILDYDVAEIPAVLSELSKAKIETLTDRFFGGDRTDDVGYSVLVCDGFGPEVLDVFAPNSGPDRVVGATYFHLEVLGFWDLLLAARTVVLTGDPAKAGATGGRLRAIGKPYDYYVPDEEQATTALAGPIGHELLTGAHRILRRGGSRAIRFTPAAALDPWSSDSPSDIAVLLDASDWPQAALAEITRADPLPTMLDVVAWENRLARTSPSERIEVVPDGYYTPGELAARGARQLRRRPWLVFRYLRSGLRVLGSR